MNSVTSTRRLAVSQLYTQLRALLRRLPSALRQVSTLSTRLTGVTDSVAFDQPEQLGQGQG